MNERGLLVSCEVFATKRGNAVPRATTQTDPENVTLGDKEQARDEDHVPLTSPSMRHARNGRTRGNGPYTGGRQGPGTGTDC